MRLFIFNAVAIFLLVGCSSPITFSHGEYVSVYDLSWVKQDFICEIGYLEDGDFKTTGKCEDRIKRDKFLKSIGISAITKSNNTKMDIERCYESYRYLDSKSIHAFPQECVNLFVP